jgi:plastocyanin
MLSRSSFTLLLAVGVSFGVAAIAGPASGGSSPAETSVTKRVSVDDDFFRPRAVSVPRGGKVVWRWRGANDHNVRFRQVPRGAKRPRGSSTKASGRFARTFRSRGTYRYVCTIHEDVGMKGRVKVG